jgi:SAM-dependent methyltransferase
MPESVACNLCGGQDAESLFTLRDHRLRVDDVDWTAVRCRRCGLGYLNPRPTAEEVERYYPAEYFQHRGSHMRRYRRMSAYVAGDAGRLLDVGTARGDFLALMKERGWTVAGIEPAVEAGNPHGLEMHRDPFPDQCDLPSNAYDVVTAWAVFEHLHDPSRAFQVCERLLRPGGKLLVQVPNLRSIAARFGLQEDVPRHLYFFSEKTLQGYGERTGLILDRVIHTTDLFGGSGRDALRLAFARATGRSVAEFFEIYRTPRKQRFRRWPVLAVALAVVGAVERVLLTDWLVRKARVSGQIVAEFHKPHDAQPVIKAS